MSARVSRLAVRFAATRTMAFIASILAGATVAAMACETFMLAIGWAHYGPTAFVLFASGFASVAFTCLWVRGRLR